MFISVDGGDGSGKGRQLQLIKDWLSENKIEFVFVRDPGDTPLGESIRSLLLDRKELDICPTSEMALFMASRAQLVHEHIRPALEAGKVVVSDRYLLSTVVYQGYAVNASENDIERIWKIGTSMASNVMPDVSFVLDCPSEIAFQRLNRPKDRIESKNLEYRNLVVEGYRRAVQDWAKYTSGKVFLLDAVKSPEEIFQEIKSILEKLL